MRPSATAHELDAEGEAARELDGEDERIEGRELGGA